LTIICHSMRLPSNTEEQIRPPSTIGYIEELNKTGMRCSWQMPTHQQARIKTDNISLLHCNKVLAAVCIGCQLPTACIGCRSYVSCLQLAGPICSVKQPGMYMLQARRWQHIQPSGCRLHVRSITKVFQLNHRLTWQPTNAYTSFSPRVIHLPYAEASGAAA
jgi:hypothetical protein